MYERISVTVALNVTVDPKSWYGRFHADPGIDIPDRMLSHLRTLPGMRETGGKVELHRLLRTGNRHCRQPAQHRCVDSTTLHPWARRNLAPTPRARVEGALRHCRRLSERLLRTYQATFPFHRRIPNRPSANFL